MDIMKRTPIVALVVVIFFVVAIFHYRSSQLSPNIQNVVAQTPTKPSVSPDRAVGALGRLEPQWKVIRLSASTSLEVGRISRLLVEEGDSVKQGQIVAVLDNHERLRAALVEAERQVDVFKARLAQIQASFKRADIQAQEALVARLEAELANAQLELNRTQTLYDNGLVATSALDARKLSVEALKKELSRARAALTSIAEVRPVDVDLARAELASAEASVKRAEANLETTYIRAMTDGQVLKIHTRPGETVGNQGVMEIGQTEQMFVVAEVFETDITKVKKGQSATIKAPSLKTALKGTVEQIGLQIGKRDILDVDPVADVDARVVEVRIKLTPEDSERVRHLTHMRVEVQIEAS